MKKIFLLLIFFGLTAGNLFSQKHWVTFGDSRIKDSTGYMTFNKSALMNYNIFVKGYITFDTLAKGRITYDGTNAVFQNEKTNGGFIFGMGDSNSVFSIYKTAGHTGLPIAEIDVTGININAGMTYKIDGVPIVAGLTNLYGYLHKDTAFTHNQHFKTKSLAIYDAGADSVRLFVKGGTADFYITPTGSNIVFGEPSAVEGTKFVYVGGLYIGDTNYLAKTTTWTGTHSFRRTYNIVSSLVGLGGAINCALTNNFQDTLSDNTTYEFSNFTEGQVINVVVYNSASYTAAWTDVVWTGAAAPTQTASATDIYSFIKVNGIIFGTYIQNY